jgi:hypothetical protein
MKITTYTGLIPTRESERRGRIEDAKANVQAALEEPHAADVDNLADAILALIEILEAE